MEGAINLLIVLVFAIIVGTIVLRKLFKNSIFLRIGAIWIINVFITVVNSRIHYNNPEAYPFWAALVGGLSFTAILLYSVSVWVRKPFSQLVDNIKDLSKGDLNIISNKQFNKKYVGELKTLNNSIIDLSNIFKTSLAKINNSAQNVDLLGVESNKMSKALSKGTNEQASALEEISASMEEMNANINATNENANKTHHVTSETNSKLVLSAESAQELNQAMALIAEKIKIIDTIAVETNLLAINAAIEAKQAGEAGAGFSVVAGEVKKLAEVSKKAADEIKEITEKGLNLSEIVSKHLNEATPSMSATMNLMEEISVASSELKSGSDQVTSAINSINLITQNNAKMSEEMSDNSNQLSNQSHELIKNIDFFKI